VSPVVKKRCSPAFARQPRPVVMGPCFRRDDERWGATAQKTFRRIQMSNSNDVQLHVRDPAARSARAVAGILRPQERGRRESRVRAAPAVSRAKWKRKTHTSIQVQRRQSGLPCAMVLTVYFVISPAIGLSCHRRWRLLRPTRPVGLTGHHQLDAGVEVSGPHDFTVRDRSWPSLRRAWYPSAEVLAQAGSASVVRAPSRRSRAKPALRPQARPTLPRPPHPTPRP
jgi:hypothetical protein